MRVALEEENPSTCNDVEVSSQLALLSSRVDATRASSSWDLITPLTWLQEV
jgi:hypothetical protein